MRGRHAAVRRRAKNAKTPATHAIAAGEDRTPDLRIRAIVIGRKTVEPEVP